MSDKNTTQQRSARPAKSVAGRRPGMSQREDENIMTQEGRMNRDEWLAEMAEHRKDPRFWLGESSEALGVSLDQWAARRPLAEAADRDTLEEMYEADRHEGERALAHLCALQRALKRIRDAVVDQLQDFDQAYYATEDHLAEQEHAASGGAE